MLRGAPTSSAASGTIARRILRQISSPAEYDWLPPNTSLDGISLVSKGVVPVAVPGLDLGQFVARQGPVPILSFANIKWSIGLTDRFRIVLLQQAFGPPHRLSASGKPVVNKMFWGHFLAEKLGLIYHARQQMFLRSKLEDQVPERVALDDLMRLMLGEIQQMARQHLTDFPLDAIGVPCLKRIIEVVKIVAGIDLPGEREDFSAFLELASLIAVSLNERSDKYVHINNYGRCLERALRSGMA